MLKEVEQRYNLWLNEPSLSSDEKAELIFIKDNENEITDRFISDLEFGTGGLRGVMGVGTNRMNRFVIRRATQGLAQYLLKQRRTNSVAIGYDSRNNSRNFALEAANVLASNNITVYIYKELMPTPALSYAVRYLKCDAGIVVTASHNPSKYNGYKVYGSDGCQLTIDAANAVYEQIQSLSPFKGISYGDFDKLVVRGKINFIDEKLISDYFDSTLKCSLDNSERILNIAYTPLYGAGYRCVTTVLRKTNFNVDVVNEQAKPNGDFPTCPYPNPEMEPALKLGIELMLKNNDDVLLATDPDSDRVGVVVNQNGKPVILTGNEVGILLFDFIYHVKKANGTLPKVPVVVKTIVSSDMVNVMAKHYGVQVNEVLTGFKFIGEQIFFLEQKGEVERYLLGFEESCGYLTNIDVRDKDAVNACLLVAEMANKYKHEGKTLFDRLTELYKEFGDFKTATLAFELTGVEGKQKILAIMESFRGNKAHELFGEIDHIGDYQEGFIHFKDHKEPTNLPKSNVIKLFLKDGETITIRPSGTEPKIKYYVFALGEEHLNKYVKTINEFMK